MQRMVLIMVVATLTYSSAALAQGSSVLGGTGGLPDHNVPGTDLPLYDPDWAKAAGAELTAMREAAAKCDRAAYDLAVRRWNFANSEMLRMWEKQAGQFARRRVADAETLRRFQQNSPDFPQFPVEKCAKKAVVDPPPPPPPPPPTPDPKPPTPPGAGVPRNITVTHRGSCPPCAGIAAKFNKAAEDYAA